MLQDACGSYYYRPPAMIPLSAWQAIVICWLFSVFAHL